MASEQRAFLRRCKRDDDDVFIELKTKPSRRGAAATTTATCVFGTTSMRIIRIALAWHDRHVAVHEMQPFVVRISEPRDEVLCVLDGGRPPSSSSEKKAAPPKTAVPPKKKATLKKSAPVLDEVADGAVRFFGPAKKNGFMSNFTHAPVVIDGDTYDNNEAWFQASKATLAGNAAVAAEIRAATTPTQAKALGGPKHLKGLDVVAWNAARDDVMLKGLRAKFAQHADLAAALLATGTATLIEASPWDSYWGEGRSKKGQNKLGKMMMVVRAELAGPPVAVGSSS